jgi:hypothetical protein
MKRTFAALATLVLVAGCNSTTPSAAPTTDAPPAMSPAPTSSPSATATVEAPKSAADLVIGYGSLGPASIGMSKADALATGLFAEGNPAPVDGCPEPPLLWKEPFKADVDVLTTEAGSIASLGVSGKGPKTKNGIGVGSTLTDLKSAYGDDLSGPSEAGYGQSGAYVEEGNAWIGFLLNEAPSAVKDTSAVTFIEVSKGERPGLMRDGC